MKLMFASDIHGSAYWAKKILERFESEEADYLVLLGDILYLSLIHISEPTRH